MPIVYVSGSLSFFQLHGAIQTCADASGSDPRPSALTASLINGDSSLVTCRWGATARPAISCPEARSVRCTPEAGPWRMVEIVAIPGGQGLPVDSLRTTRLLRSMPMPASLQTSAVIGSPRQAPA